MEITKVPDYIQRALRNQDVVGRNYDDLTELLQYGYLDIIGTVKSEGQSPERIETNCQAHHFYAYGDSCANSPDCSTPKNYAPQYARQSAWNNLQDAVKTLDGNAAIHCRDTSDLKEDGSCTVRMEALACRYTLGGSK